MEELLHMVSADETEIHVHEVDVSNIVHKEEELCLSTWRLGNQLMHLLERWHVWSLVSEMAHDVIANVFH